MSSPIQPEPHSVLHDPGVLDQCMLADVRRLRSGVAAARDRVRRGQPADELLRKLAAAVERSRAIARDRAARRPRVEFPAELPISSHVGELRDAIRSHQVVVVCGDTGSGKSTQLPKLCLEMGRGVRGMIGHTQPRRLAARTVAARVAEELGTELGDAVGYKVRFTDETKDRTLVKVMTDGILLAEVQGDPLLERYDTIIVDEAHERSLNIDFLLGVFVHLLPRRPDLKLIITSATIDPQRLSEHFGGPSKAPVLQVSGRMYPVEVRYRPIVDPEDAAAPTDGHEDALEEAVLGAVREVLGESPQPAGSAMNEPGDLLVFLSTEQEIRDTADLLRNRLPREQGVEVLPLFSRLATAEQMRVFQRRGSGAPRRIVLATNVAETSVTVPGIRAVIDTGLARISRYSPRTKVQRLPIEPVSQASAEQRKGRCGRLGPGVCIRLYDQADFESRPKFTEPEILRTNLAGAILRMLALRLGDPRTFPFVDRPDERLIRDGYDTLVELGAVSDKGELTNVGRELARLPVDPRIGRMILAATRERCLPEVLVIAAGLSAPDPRERPAGNEERADLSHARFRNERSDFISMLRLWQYVRKESAARGTSQFRKLCREDFLSFVRIREWEDLHRQLSELVRDLGLDNESQRDNARSGGDDQIHRALLAGLLSSVGHRQQGGGFEFTGPRGVKFNLFPGSALFKDPPKWVMAAELVKTTRLYARTAAAIKPQWIERAAAHLLHRSYEDPHWDARSGSVLAYERAKLEGLEVVTRRPVPFGPVDPATARALFIQHALVDGAWATGGEFASHNLALLQKARRLEAKARRPLLTAPTLRYDFFDQRLPQDVNTGRAFEAWRSKAERRDREILFMRPGDLLAEPAENISGEAYPDAVRVLGSRLAIEYKAAPGEADDGVTLTVPLEALAAITSAAGDWLVPGMLHETITELIRTLPKHLRVNFVPAPESAKKCVEFLQVHPELKERSLVDALAEALGRVGGVGVQPSDLRPEELSAHLRMNYRVVDSQGNALASGRDVDVLRRSLSRRLAGALAAIPSPFNRDGKRRWDFGDLPEVVRVATPASGGGLTLDAFPALVDARTSVSIRLHPTSAAASIAHRAGVRRMCELELEHEVRLCLRRLEYLGSLRVMYAQLGPAEELEASLLRAAIDRVFLDGRPEIREQAAFHKRLAERQDELEPALRQLAAIAAIVLNSGRAVALEIESLPSPTGDASASDLARQLGGLVVPGFIERVPTEWLKHYPRYFAAMRRRIEQLRAGKWERDDQRLAQLRPFLEALERIRSGPAESAAADADLFRWMIEEYRVSVFAQDLGTAMPVSPERLGRLSARLGEGV